MDSLKQTLQTVEVYINCHLNERSKEWLEVQHLHAKCWAEKKIACACVSYFSAGKRINVHSMAQLFFNSTIEFQYDFTITLSLLYLQCEPIGTHPNANEFNDVGVFDSIGSAPTKNSSRKIRFYPTHCSLVWQTHVFAHCVPLVIRVHRWCLNGAVYCHCVKYYVHCDQIKRESSCIGTEFRGCFINLHSSQWAALSAHIHIHIHIVRVSWLQAETYA